MKPLKILLLVAAVAALGAGATAAFGHTAHTAGAAATVKSASSKYGTILVTSSGKTLYLDAGDKPPHFACTGACIKAWPPLVSSGKPKAAGKVKASMLGTVKNGKFNQVTYNGHPLYTFMSDTSSGAVTGEDVNGFFVVGPGGAKISHAPSSSTTTSSSSSSSSAGGAYGY
jgi:predicted lipoprotein with Yx(FWY)xxD motif